MTSFDHSVFLREITGLFMSPSGISELDCATTKTDTAERRISIGRESLQILFCRTADLSNIYIFFFQWKMRAEMIMHVCTHICFFAVTVGKKSS
jgi:hypothetical protein